MAAAAAVRDAAVVVIPSSSPIEDHATGKRQHMEKTRDSSARTSSSPGLPSPSEFMRGSQRAHNETPKTVVPAPALGGFRSVASLVRDGFRGDETTLEKEKVTKKGAVQKTKKKSKAGSAKGEKIVSAETVTPQSRPRNAELQAVLEHEMAPESVDVLLPPSAQRVDGGPCDPQVEDQGVIEVQKAKKATKRAAPRTPGTTARSRKRLKKSESMVINSDEPEAVQKSVYFASQKHDAVPQTTHDDAPVPQVEPTTRQDQVPAPTITAKVDVPVQLSASSPPRPPSAEPETMARSLSDVLGNLVYDPVAAQTPKPRAPSGESFTKRRRIDLTDGPAIAPPTTTKKQAKALDSPERAVASVKKQKKRPLTITELATAAYRPPEAEAVVDQLPVDAFLVPVQPAASTTGTSDEPASTKAAKVSKPRKPRAKRKMVIINADGTKTLPPVKAAKAPKTPKTPKPRKSKVKFKEEDLIAPLLSPQRARNVERSQGFLFGTSSQLAVEESPQCIRDMQLAIRLSEAGPSSQISMPEEIRSTLPPVRRPDTSISVGVTRRGLWRQATRDGEGLLHRSLTAVEEGGAGLEPAEEAERADIVADDGTSAARPAPDLVNEDTAELPGVVSEMALPIEHSVPDADPVLASLSPDAPSSQPVSDDNWMLLPSDSSAVDAETVQDNAPIPIASSPLRLPTLQRAATSPMPRSPLRSLDSNMPLFQSARPEKAPLTSHRQFLSTASTEPAKKPRGRPKKQAAAELAENTAPKKRGRPKKDKAQAAVPGNALSALTPPRPSPHTAPSQWTHIDEISDSEPPLTPSPPRQRATSSPPVLQPLELAPSPSPTKTITAPSVAIRTTATIKTTDAAWQEIKMVLFPQITRLVKSTPPSTEMNRPTWHEKMLLYDPIVLEDLTAWLNANGLRYEYRRARPKSRRKSKKKKDDDDERVDEPEFDLASEELKPWMVQKWCEEKSVCCLWKEGLRGGVRVRY